MDLSVAEARRIALHAQGLGKPRPATKPTARHVRAVVSTLGAVQIDAVNVLERAHYVTVYSRLGPYPSTLLDEVTHKRRAAFEYLGHAASILPMELYPALRWRMARLAEDRGWLAFQARVESERPGYVAAVEREVAEHGPIAFTDLRDPARRQRAQTKYAESSLLWSRSADGKSVLEGLFNAGRLAAAGRKGFERLYDLTERVIPADVLARPALPALDAHRALVLHAARALGVATIRDLAYYFFLPVATTKARVRELVDNGDLRAVRVEGWPQEAYAPPRRSSPPVGARTLLSPFDSLLFERSRVERLFGFTHSFELYVKPANRRYGYFVLPFLLDDRLVARVDLKADRTNHTLLVRGAFAEPGVDTGRVAGELAAELRELAGWLGLHTIEVADHGDLAVLLRVEVRAG